MKSYENRTIKAKCPVCGAHEANVLWQVTSKQAAQHYVLKEKDPERYDALVQHIEKLWGKSTCEVVQCDQCKFCFSYPYVAGDERFYTLAYARSGYPKWKWEFQVTYDVLKKIDRTDSTLIEIGAGDGAFVRKVAQDLLPKENIFCTEFSEYGRNQIKDLDIRCVPRDVRDLSEPEFANSADVICLFQVLEHLDRLDELFAKLNWLLKPGGSIFIAVPNQHRIEFNELNGALLDMPPNHVGRWNQGCFAAIGKRHNLLVADYKIEESSFVSTIKDFIIYRLLRKSQESGSLSNRLRSVRNRHLQKFGNFLGVAVNAVTAIPAIVSLISVKSKLGSSQWVHLVRK